VSLDKSLELVGNFAFLAGGILCIFQSQAFRGSVLFDAAGRQAVAAALVLLALPVSFLLSIAAGRHPVSGLVRTGARFLPGRRWPALSARLPACREVYELIFVGEVQMTRFCREQSLTVVQALLVSLISWAGALGEYWLALHFLGQNLTLTQALSALTAARLALLVPVPGGLGALEASQVLALRALGISPVVGVSLSLLIRARDVTLGCLGLWWGGVNS
jgi:uncharacterized membrane protein YbhN (UPF0104 family)